MSEFKNILLEACVDSLPDAIQAEQAGADRIELCSMLEVGGLFPGKVLLQQVIKECSLPISVMIRARPGKFEYSHSEIDIMVEQIEICLELGVYGVVFGASRGENMDRSALEELITTSGSLSVTIHKVVDAVGNPIEHIKQLITIPGVDRILSSGGKQTAWEGRFVLKEMMELAENHFSIMPGGKVTHTNLAELDSFLEAKEYHGRQIV